MCFGDCAGDKSEGECEGDKSAGEVCDTLDCGLDCGMANMEVESASARVLLDSMMVQQFDPILLARPSLRPLDIMTE